MHLALSFTVVAAALAFSAEARLSSGVYRLDTGNFEAALAHTSADAQTITAERDTLGVANQVWSLVSNESASTVTIQNIATLRYVAPDALASQVVPSSTPFVWNVHDAGFGPVFCFNAGTSGEQCISWTFPSTVLTLQARGAIVNGGGQTFGPVPTAPPAGWYQIQNLKLGTVLASNGVPSAAVLRPFPASDRSEIWLVTPSGENIPPTFSLSNLANGGFLSINGTTVGTYSNSTPFFWDCEFDDAFLVSAQVIQLPNTTTNIEGTATGIVIGNGGFDRALAWVFYPVDVNEFSA